MDDEDDDKDEEEEEEVEDDTNLLRTSTGTCVLSSALGLSGDFTASFFSRCLSHCLATAALNSGSLYSLL